MLREAKALGPSRVPDPPGQKAATSPQSRSSSVRTPDGLSCPVCRTKVLRGRQTVCSPRCRAKRHRQRREEEGRKRDVQMAEYLQAALRLVTGQRS